MERGMKTTNKVQAFFVLKRILSAVKRTEFVNDRMSYIILSGRWCHIIVLNNRVSTEYKIDMKNSIYEKLECMFSKFPKYHTIILLIPEVPYKNSIFFDVSRWENPQSD
jgi:hypothetical protein